MDKPRRILRCAIYTRKSSEEGLEQAFNSLDAQREACAAFIMSQTHEGWVALPALYDDGGYSGGSLERPALQRLLAEIAAGRINVIVVYKVDRLTRSLSDFSKIVELLDRHGASFVSVTQQFNSTTSMGRLTLNVLLSFAQFEREVTGERIRDKIAASKKKGMWMGGALPLGYDLRQRKLVINPTEAEQVRIIFRRYLESGSILGLAAHLRREGVVSKRWTTQAGKVTGGKIFSRGALYHLLRNPIYIGKIRHRETVYPGEHPPLLAPDLWEEAQAMLSGQRRKPIGPQKPASAAKLIGRLFDDRSNRMSPSHTRKRNGVRYLYYVSQALLQNRPAGAGSLPRISAPQLEGFIAQQLRRFGAGKMPAPAVDDRLWALLQRVELSAEWVRLIFAEDPALEFAIERGLPDGASVDCRSDAISLTLPSRFRVWGGKTWIESPTETITDPHRDAALIKAVLRAHAWREALETGATGSLEALALQNGCTTRYVRVILELAFLPPALTTAILAGRQPRQLTLARLVAAPLPLSWRRQCDAFNASGFLPHPIR